MKLFNSIRVKAPKLNKFDLSHERKMSMNLGWLYPMLVQEILPGDRFRVNTEVMMRLAPMVAPVMHRMNVFVHYFFVPNRLLWSGWEDFITGGRLGNNEAVPPHIYVNGDSVAARFSPRSLPDYMGLPNMIDDPVTDPIRISSLPFRAYTLIWNEYYRDQNLVEPVDIAKDAAGAETLAQMNAIMSFRKRCWEKDYFTSALPWAQRGGDVSIPIEAEGSVTYLDNSAVYTAAGGIPTSGNLRTQALDLESLRVGATDLPGRIENIDEVTMDNVTATINDLRRSVRLQEWLEKNARAGSRYVEQLLAHFGVISPDARLQRPEFLGGGRSPITISEVLSTFQDDSIDSDPLGEMGGHGVSYGNKNGFSKRFLEHGIVMGLISVLPKTAYQQGVPRDWQRMDRFDYAFPEFANIGEQEIKQSELYYNQAAAAGVGDATFGYQSRYAEYKYKCSSVHGEFRTNLDYWHMGRIFASAPALNENFVNSDPTYRIFAVNDTENVDHLYCHMYNKIDALRPLPYFGTPTL